MKREYEKPSMAVNKFDTVDTVNITEQSLVAPKAIGDRVFNRTGVTVIDSSKLHS